MNNNLDFRRRRLYVENSPSLRLFDGETHMYIGSGNNITEDEIDFIYINIYVKYNYYNIPGLSSDSQEEHQFTEIYDGVTYGNMRRFENNNSMINYQRVNNLPTMDGERMNVDIVFIGDYEVFLIREGII